LKINTNNYFFKKGMIKMSKSVVIIVLIVASSFLFLAGSPVQAEDGQFDTSLRKGETRQTLDPALFSNPTIKKAYEVAKAIPWILDSIYCYCFCQESPVFRHKSLLSCYVDDHAAQ
jgi:hypothetical protein